MRVVGLVLHPERDSTEAVDAVLGWAARREIEVLGIEAEVSRGEPSYDRVEVGRGVSAKTLQAILDQAVV